MKNIYMPLRLISPKETTIPPSTHDILGLRRLWESLFGEPPPQDLLSSGLNVTNNVAGQDVDDSSALNTDQAVVSSSESLAAFPTERAVTAGHDFDAGVERDSERELALAVVPSQGLDARKTSTKDPIDRPPLPAFVVRHFVAKDGRFFFKQRPEQLAFEDRGSKLRAAVESQQVATALVEIATMREWTALRVSGSKAFRRAVWFAAAERGIEVSGYRPKDGELALMEQRRSAHSDIPHRQGSKPSQVEGHEQLVNRLAGEVVAHGHAPYLNASSGSPSYYVSLRNADGEVTTHWGVDLERVIDEAGIQVGDAVELARRGKERVQVRQPGKDANGQVVDSRSREMERNVWSVTLVNRSRETAQGASKPTHDPVLLKAVAFFEKRFAELSNEQRAVLREQFRALFDQIYPQVAAQKAAREFTAVAPSDDARQAEGRSEAGRVR